MNESSQMQDPSWVGPRGESGHGSLGDGVDKEEKEDLGNDSQREK